MFRGGRDGQDSKGSGLQWRGVRVDRAARVVRQADKVLAPQPPISDGFCPIVHNNSIVAKQVMTTQPTHSHLTLGQQADHKLLCTDL